MTWRSSNDSLERCQRHPRDFVTRFYDLFIGASEEVIEKFKHTDLGRQKRMLAISLYHMVRVIAGNGQARAVLEQVAQIHSKA